MTPFKNSGRRFSLLFLLHSNSITKARQFTRYVQNVSKVYLSHMHILRWL